MCAKRYGTDGGCLLGLLELEVYFVQISMTWPNIKRYPKLTQFSADGCYDGKLNGVDLSVLQNSFSRTPHPKPLLLTTLPLSVISVLYLPLISPHGVKTKNASAQLKHFCYHIPSVFPCIQNFKTEKNALKIL